jgi:hypothetical protein
MRDLACISNRGLGYTCKAHELSATITNRETTCICFRFSLLLVVLLLILLVLLLLLLFLLLLFRPAHQKLA